MSKILIKDYFNIKKDQVIKNISLALDPVFMEKEIKENLNLLVDKKNLALKKIKVLRYKKNRRVLIEYSFGKISILGKIRAKHSARSAYKLMKKIWDKGLNDKNVKGVTVAKPLGYLNHINIWFQEKIQGQSLADLFKAKKALKLMKKVAYFSYKIQKMKIPIDKKHTIADELRILDKYLKIVISNNPKLEFRIQNILNQCYRISGKLTKQKLTNIHRDFYQDQFIVNKDMLYLIDFDLYCHGDPGLDIGNFLAHITEQSLRDTGNSGFYSQYERQLEKQFVHYKGKKIQESVKLYTMLSLARHIYLSTLFEKRKYLTEKIIKLCEEKLLKDYGIK